MSKRAKKWVAWYYQDWLEGTRGMDVYEIGLYDFLLNMIYDHDGPIPANQRAYQLYAHRLKMRIDHFHRVLQNLIDLGKIIVADGVLSNKRAENEMGERTRRVEQLARNLSEGRTKAAREASEGRLEAVPKKREVQKNGSEINSTTAHLGADNNNNINKNKDSKSASPMPPPGLARARAARIDPQRTLSDQNITFARARGLTRKEIDREWDKFKSYYRGLSDSHRNSKSPDWDAVWEGWVLRACERLGRDPLVEAVSTPVNGHHRSPAEIGRDEWVGLVETWRKTGIWHPDLGPEPGSRGCFAPPDLVNPS